MAQLIDGLILFLIQLFKGHFKLVLVGYENDISDSNPSVRLDSLHDVKGGDTIDDTGRVYSGTSQDA